MGYNFFCSIELSLIRNLFGGFDNVLYYGFIIIFCCYNIFKWKKYFRQYLCRFLFICSKVSDTQSGNAKPQKSPQIFKIKFNKNSALASINLNNLQIYVESELWTVFR